MRELAQAAPHDARPPEVRVHFDGVSGCIAQARATTAAFLRRHAPHADPTSRDDALLVVSELVTNAVRHAPGPLTLELELLPAGVRITVEDTSPRPPRPRPPGRAPDRPRGRGWPIVQRLAHRVRVVPRHDGKSVHVELAWQSPAG